MAEVVRLTAGLVALTTFTFESSRTLWTMLDEYRNRSRNVRDLKQEYTNCVVNKKVSIEAARAVFSECHVSPRTPSTGKRGTPPVCCSSTNEETEQCFLLRAVALVSS